VTTRPGGTSRADELVDTGGDVTKAPQGELTGSLRMIRLMQYAEYYWRHCVSECCG